MKKLIILLLLIYHSTINAQTLEGPISPCVNCEQLNARTEPLNGVWFNPDQSGTGIGIDVQNGTVFGAYYGYDNQGKQIWLTFVGELMPSDDVNIMWTVDADLLQFENGNAFNQTYATPVTTEYQGKIHLKFTQKNHALFSVNGGQEQNIVPIVFGIPASADFAEQTSYLLPSLEGMWNFVFKVNSEIFPSAQNQWGMFSLMLDISEKFNDLDLNQNGITEINYLTKFYGPPPEIQPFGRIECDLVDNNTTATTPECVFVFAQGLRQISGEEDRFHFSLGGLGAYRLFGETLDGHTFEAIKIDSTEYQSKKVQQPKSTQSIHFSELAGPSSPCVTCSQLNSRTEPFNGIWYNPEQSGSGFSLDIQNGTAFGAYYGYDEQGQQLWLTFVGSLVPSTDANIMWTLDADLLQFENGNSFNESYQSPNTTDYSGSIQILFTHENHAVFSVNNGDAQNIVPIIFGTSATADFADHSSYLLPELSGMWTLTYQINWLIPGPYSSFPNQWGFIPRMVEIGKKTIHNEGGQYWVSYDVKSYTDFPNIFELGQIKCEVVSDGLGNEAPECVFTDNFGILGYPDEPTPEFHFPLGGLGAYRLFGETLDGHTFEAIKINSVDYNISGS